MKKWLIYCHTNLINNKKYIGLTHHTDNPNKRWYDGKAYYGEKSHHKIFCAAIKKYGWENFSHEILEENIGSIEEANEREKYWIAYYHTYVGDPECRGYNATIGGDETKGRIMSEAEKEYRRQLKLGTHASEETKKKMSETRKGKPQHMTEKKIAQINAMHDKWRGCHQSEEVKQRIRETSTGRLHSEKTKKQISESKYKKVLCVELNKIFNGIQAAADFVSVNYYAIYKCVADNSKTTCGYHWKYIENKENN